MKKMSLGTKGKVWLTFLFTILIVACGGAWWYFGIYTKTPEYAIKKIEEAVSAHDQGQFDKYVDVQRITETASEEFLEGMMDADLGLTEEARSAVANFAQMFKMSVSKSFQSAIREYVRTGEWNAQSVDMPDAQLILEKAGLAQIEPRGIEGLEKNAEDGRATLGLRLYQKEAAGEFVLKVRFEKSQDGIWRATQISNFREFIAFVVKARKEQLREYLKKTEDIMRAHEDKVSAADKKLVAILQNGSMGDMAVRRQMRAVMADEILPDWKLRRSELEAVEPPSAAQPLHRLRLKICDKRISYALHYADWLETKKAGDIHEANEILKEVRTLEQEAEAMTRRMQRKPL